MEKKVDTPKKRPAKPFRGAVDGKPFTKENQPDPQLKKAGWEKWRKERMLTQAIIKKMLGVKGEPTKTMQDFVTKLIQNANRGNPKAIDVLCRSLEDDIIKIAQTDKDGNDVQQYDLSKLSNDDLRKLVELQSKIRVSQA